VTEKSTRLSTPETSRTGVSPAAKASTTSRVANHLTEDIRSSAFAELLLVVLTFCTGMQGRWASLPWAIPLVTDRPYRCHNISRLPLLCLEPDRQHRVPVPGSDYAAAQRGILHHLEHRHGSWPLPRGRVADRPTEPHHRCSKTMVAHSVQLCAKLLRLGSRRHSIPLWRRGPGLNSTRSRRLARVRRWKPGCPVAESCHDRNQHGHGDGSLGRPPD